MKIRSVLLGSAAIAGLSTAGYAADLGVVTSLDLCDQLGIPGLNIASSDNCLTVSGNIAFEYDVGDFYNGVGGNVGDSAYGGHFFRDDPKNVKPTFPGADGNMDSAIHKFDWWLKFVATSSTDFGPAKAVLKIGQNNWNQGNNINGQSGTISIEEAWVGVGDTTMLMAGYKGTIFNTGDDVPLYWLGLFNSSDVNTGVGFNNSITNGHMSIQVVSSAAGNGISLEGGLENLNSSNGSPTWSAVGTLAYAGNNITAHSSLIFNQNSNWQLHTGFTGSFDKLKVVAALAADNGTAATGYTTWWNALASASYTFDMFTLAGSVEATSANEWGVSGSVSATVSDGVSLNFGGRYFTNGTNNVTQVQAGISAAVTEAITLSGSVGAYEGDGTTPQDFYGIGKVSWSPGGGFSSSASLEAHSTGGYKAVYTASK